MNQPRWTTALVALALAATPSALPHKKGNHADDWTPGQTIKVCVCDTPGGEDISGPLQNAMTIWNNSKGGFNGGVLFEWHLSLTDCSEQRRRSATCGSVGIRERAGEPSSPAWIRWR